MSAVEAIDTLHKQATAHCTAIVRSKAHSFYFASRFLPLEKRDAVYALYAFCRTVDDIADLPPVGASRESIAAQLADWRRWLHAGAPVDHKDPVKYALAQVARAGSLPLDPLIDLVDTVSDDLAPRHLPDFGALERYCYGVAGTVGVAMASLLGARESAAFGPARDLGIAMQLTNVLRDVGEDLMRLRIYLPCDEMAQWGYGPADLHARVIDQRFISLMRLQILRARRYYAVGMSGLSHLPPDSQLPIALAARAYARILDKIEQANYDVFTRRARTGRRDKLLLATRLYARRWRGGAPVPVPV